MTGHITLVPTPIGNLGDITLRALEVLKAADEIWAEDTRHSHKLLAHYQIQTRVRALHKDNEHAVVGKWLEQVAAQHMRIAVVSDAGTPGISDPGFLVVREALRQSIPVECLPGPTAIIPALVASGLPCNRFVFEGFLPPKKGRQTRLQALATEERTIILYESPHKILKTLADLAALFGTDRSLCLARELTKIHETYLRGTLGSVLETVKKRPPKGEIVLIIAGINHSDREITYETTDEDGLDIEPDQAVLSTVK
jgi:16S rRNA (cytidine1402-2'-O)-methyltransferase